MKTNTLIKKITSVVLASALIVSVPALASEDNTAVSGEDNTSGYDITLDDVLVSDFPEGSEDKTAETVIDVNEDVSYGDTVDETEDEESDSVDIAEKEKTDISSQDVSASEDAADVINNSDTTMPSEDNADDAQLEDEIVSESEDEEENTVEIEAAADRHTHNVVTDAAIEATLFKKGLTEGSRCIDCGEIIKAQEETEMKPLVHTLVYGSSGPDVLEVQHKLYELGYLTVQPDGIFGRYTREAVSNFQRINGLNNPDGMFGQWSLGVMRGEPKPYSVTQIQADDIYSVQERLFGLGFLTVEYGGYFGSYTIDALKKYQIYNGLPVTGQIDDPTLKSLNSGYSSAFRSLRQGMSGDDVHNLQTALIKLGYLDAAADGIFGNKTKAAVNKFQQENGLSNPDGIFGRWSLERIINAEPLSAGDDDDISELHYGMSGAAVKKMQQFLRDQGYLNVTPDGIFGNLSLRAVKAFQYYNGQTVTGVADVITLELLYSSMGLAFRNLRLGSDGMDVLKVETELSRLGYLETTPDTTFDQNSRIAVVKFQQNNGLANPDGVFGLWSVGVLLSNPKAYVKTDDQSGLATSANIPADPVITGDKTLGEQLVEYAKQWVGITPYRSYEERVQDDGSVSNSLITGTDCSGFVYLIFQKFGFSLTTASDAYQDSVGVKITREELLPGDIVVYRNGGHVAIYAGEGMVVHTSNPNAGTVIWSIDYDRPTAYVRIAGVNALRQ